MTIDTTIDQYRATKDAMAATIDRHMRSAFAEIQAEFGATPTYVDIRIEQAQTLAQKHPAGVYAGCSVSLGGE